LAQRDQGRIQTVRFGWSMRT